MDFAEAADLLESLTDASHKCLDALKIPREPLGKVRPWKDGSPGPVGVGYHYTGGPNGIKSLRWFNDPRMGNALSSAHCVILDRLIPELEDVWLDHDVSRLFAAPTILCADPGHGTWNINWANSRCFGIELRNTGYSGWGRLDHGIATLGKTAQVIGAREYEPYAAEQIKAAVLLTRIWAAIRGEAFDTDWMVGHSQIWGTKNDPGPHFPSMHAMREMLDDDVALDDITRLYPSMLDGEDPLDHDLPAADSRGDPDPIEQSWDVPAIEVTASDVDQEVLTSLYRLGWPVGVRIGAKELTRFVTYFQRSSLAWKRRRPERVLSVDGVAGPKTVAALRRRLQETNL